MKHNDYFKKFVNRGVKENFFIGTGNPNAKILFIGKESAISELDVVNNNSYLRNAQDWQTHIDNNTCEKLEYDVCKNHSLRKGWGKNTWSKYQKLSNYILGTETENFKIDFLKDVFTTEINDAPSLNTNTADKNSLNFRKNLFKESSFIQEFPVIVLACSDYITNNDEMREIDEIFGVTYDGDKIGKHWYNKGNWFFTHRNEDGDKLVIHTRQLSADVKNEMLEKMGLVIKTHLGE